MDNLELLRQRHSVRAYLNVELSDHVKNKLRSVASFVNSHEAGIRLVPIFNDDSPFRGFGRSYGMFRNVTNYLAVIIDNSFENSLERAGYFAEEFAMEAVNLGLGTCFVGGTFSKEHVNTFIEVYEKIPFVVAFGESDNGNTSVMAKITSSIVHRKTVTSREFFEGTDDVYRNAVRIFPWLPVALDALACAPSALNSRPVRLAMIESRILDKDNNCIHVPEIVAFTIAPNKYATELGIAKFNIAFAVGGTWKWGENAPFSPDDAQ